MTTAVQGHQLPVLKGGSFLIEERAPGEIFKPEDFSEEHLMIARTAEEYVVNEVRPLEDAMEAKDFEAIRGLIRKAGELGLCSIDIPEVYGGLGLDKISSMIVSEKMAGSASFATTFGSHAGIGCLPIVFFGNDEQKKRYLPRLATGEIVGAYALTEAGSGSDALAAKTKAVLNEAGTHYVLNGEKMWITNGGFADIYVVFAKVDGEHFTAFLVERGFPGFSNGPEEHKLGINGSSTCALRLDNVPVPVENVLGEIGKGHKIAFNILNIGRFKLGAACVGGAKLAMREAVRYAKDRKQFGAPIASFGMIQHKIGEMAIRIFAGESMLYRTAGLIEALLNTLDKNNPAVVLQSIEEYAVECSTIKVWASEMVDYVIDEEVQIYGGNGYSRDYPAEKHYRDSRINRIFEGTSEINRLLIPAMLLKRAMKGELPLLPAAQKLMAEVMSFPQLEEESDELLAAERKAVANAKKIALLVAAAGVQRFRDEIKDQQELLALEADIVMQTFAMESAVLRALALAESGAEKAEYAAKMARVFVSDSLQMVDAWGKQALAATLEGDDLRTMLAAHRRFAKHQPVNTVVLRREIAARVIELERYPM
jgi:alkylation response protein AidB-like acyl-CoA dehydrogenase